jgi:hypothetical protein
MWVLSETVNSSGVSGVTCLSQTWLSTGLTLAKWPGANDGFPEANLRCLLRHVIVTSNMSGAFEGMMGPLLLVGVGTI